MSIAKLCFAWANYEQSFIQDIHQLVAMGYTDVRAELNAEREEEDITGLMVEAIQDRLDRLGGKWARYNVKETAPARGAGLMGKRRKELDIVMECSSHLPRNRFVFEAKRLRAPGHPIGDYAGEAGLLCFLRGDYAGDSHFAGMLGYIQSHDHSRWFDQLSNKFGGDPDDSLRIVRDLSPISVSKDLQHEWTSEHKRANGTSITVYHLFLMCYQPN